MDKKLSRIFVVVFSKFCFVFYWGQVPQGSMHSLSVVPNFNKLKYINFCLRYGGWFGNVYQFGFEGFEADAARKLSATALFQQLPFRLILCFTTG